MTYSPEFIFLIVSIFIGTALTAYLLFALSKMSLDSKNVKYVALFILIAFIVSLGAAFYGYHVGTLERIQSTETQTQV